MNYWFTCDALFQATLCFLGDDDVSVFVNSGLAIDLGGVHVPVERSAVMDADNDFGMTDGKVYCINIFLTRFAGESL